MGVIRTDIRHVRQNLPRLSCLVRTIATTVIGFKGELFLNDASSGRVDFNQNTIRAINECEHSR
ncbi:hypothetical protein BSF38_00206 [Paludisphaera borealis]|uniref:Uncharacterized protein n=1 Tax=Paludisphaera borealis TaxID=1387353 RepID=A0A1U7CIP1_9BACT|nr:hypothetical protein BSF38_00206 [Paludisphaera borealis]